MRRNDGGSRGQMVPLLHRLGRLSLMLAAAATTDVVCMPSAGAIAATRHTAPASHHAAHHGHNAAAAAVVRPMRGAARGHRKRSYVRVSPAHGPAHYAGAMHRDAVPLANTTWDDPQIPPAVVDAIQEAARESGVDPHLLTAIAWRESRFRSDARNGQSSAKGLLQFTTETWLQVVRAYGSQHNVGRYAAAIRRDQSGALIVSGRGMRAAILRLRNDPVLSAKLAAQNMSQQVAAMQARLGRNVAPADLYLLHVLGPTGSERFLTAVAQHPSESSVRVASYDVMRNAGLLAGDGRPMTVANTYAAAGAMLETQRARSEPPAPALKAGGDAAGGDAVAAMPIQVSAAP